MRVPVHEEPDAGPPEVDAEVAHPGNVGGAASPGQTSEARPGRPSSGPAAVGKRVGGAPRPWHGSRSSVGRR